MKLIHLPRTAFAVLLCTPAAWALEPPVASESSSMEPAGGASITAPEGLATTARMLAGGLAVGVGTAAVLRSDRAPCSGSSCAASSAGGPDMSPQISANGEQIARNRADIVALRDAFNGIVPDPGDVLRIDKDRIVQLRGARLADMGEGAIGPDSREGVNGAQLYATHKRVGLLEYAGQYAKVGADDESRPAEAAHLSSAFGSDARAVGNGATALGAYTLARGRNSVALGRGAHVAESGPEGFALGPRARVSAENGVALGASTQVWEAGYNSVAIGYGSVATQPMEVSVGGQGMYRRITNLSPGVDEADAVNLGQLRRVEKNLSQRLDGMQSADAAPAGEAEVAAATVAEVADAPVASEPAPPPAPRAPAADTAAAAVDARAVDEAVDRANAYTDQALTGVGRRLDRLDRRLSRMAAMGGAQAAMAMNTAGLPTANRLGAGVGHADGESALAVGYQRVLALRAPTTFSLNGAFSNGGERTVAVGVGVGW